MEFAVGDDDQFASLIMPNCQPTASQEEKLRVCPFARESEISPGDTQSSCDTQRTGIIMVSLPESSDDYQTPPEQHSYSQNSINDGQVPPTRTADVDKKLEGGGGGDGEAVVVDGGLEREGLRTVDLTKDTDNLGFSEKSPGFLKEDNGTAVVTNNDTDRIEAEDEVVKIEAENGVTEAVSKELIGSPTDNSHKVFDEMPMREQKESMSVRISSTSVKNIEDIDRFRYVGNRRKRELPSSMEQGKSTGGEGDYENHIRDFVDVLELVLMVLDGEVKGASNGEEDDDDTDFLETAKRRGMNFPRPRWWPEGFEDQT